MSAPLSIADQREYERLRNERSKLERELWVLEAAARSARKAANAKKQELKLNWKQIEPLARAQYPEIFGIKAA